MVLPLMYLGTWIMFLIVSKGHMTDHDYDMLHNMALFFILIGVSRLDNRSLAASRQTSSK